MIHETVTVVGLGGIGSWVAHAVARAGCSRLVLCDPDAVEAHNLENQNYEPQHIGHLKTEATRRAIEKIRRWHHRRGHVMAVQCVSERIGAEACPRGIVIVAVDTVEARREIFDACRYTPAVSLYIEAGAAAHQGVVRAFVPHNKDHVEVYEELLKAYSVDGPAPCVTPSMEGQFSAVILHWVRRFEEKRPPVLFYETRFDYRDVPRVDTSLVTLYP